MTLTVEAALRWIEARLAEEDGPHYHVWQAVVEGRPCEAVACHRRVERAALLTWRATLERHYCRYRNGAITNLCIPCDSAWPCREASSVLDALGPLVPDETAAAVEK